MGSSSSKEEDPNAEPELSWWEDFKQFWFDFVSLKTGVGQTDEVEDDFVQRGDRINRTIQEKTHTRWLFGGIGDFLDSLSDGTKEVLKTIQNILEAIWSVIKKIGKGVFNIWKMYWDILTGKAYDIWGIAPYISIIGMAMLPVQYLAPNMLDYPFQFIGVEPVNLVSFQVFSLIYFMLLYAFNFWYT